MLIRHLIAVLRISGFDLKCMWKNLFFNYMCSAVKRDKGVYLYIYPNVIVSIEKTAMITLHGSLSMGIPSIKGNRRISKFLMKASSKFVVNDGCAFLDEFDVQIHQKGFFSVDNFHSNIGLEISCGQNIVLHGCVMAGRRVRIKDYNGHVVSYKGYPKSAPITIENHVWLCSGASVCPGVTISEGSVIGDNANVVSDIPIKSFVQGNPAKIIETNISWSE